MTSQIQTAQTFYSWNCASISHFKYNICRVLTTVNNIPVIFQNRSFIISVWHDKTINQCLKMVMHIHKVIRCENGMYIISVDFQYLMKFPNISGIFFNPCTFHYFKNLKRQYFFNTYWNSRTMLKVWLTSVWINDKILLPTKIRWEE